MLPLKPEIIPYAVELTLEQACGLEKQLIAAFRESFDLINVTEGGEGTKGVKPSLETRRKMSLVLMGNTRCVGYKHSLESRKRMSESQKGRVAWNKGIPSSIGSRKKQSIAMTGEKNPFYGKTQKASLETREKIRKAAMGNQNARKKK